jgi:hypothetical protein
LFFPWRRQSDQAGERSEVGDIRGVRLTEEMRFANDT